MGPLRVSLAVLLAAIAGAPDARAMQGGADDATHAFAVGVCGGTPASCAIACSGVLLAPNLVVTARSCVQESPAQLACATSSFGELLGNAGDYWITTDASMRQALRGWHAVQQLLVVPTPRACGADLALLILSDVIAPSEATPIAPSLDAPIDAARFGGAVTAIGYGLTSVPSRDPDAGAGDSSGHRRAVPHVPILCVPGDADAALACDPVTMNGVPVDPNEMLVGDGPCPGDAGGAALAQSLFDQGSFVAVGIVSRSAIDPGAPTRCRRAVVARFDPWADFLRLGAHQASLLGGYPEPDWTRVASDAGPEAGPTAVSAAATSPTAKSGGCAQSPAAAAEGPFFPLALIAGLALVARRRRRAS